MKQLSAYDIDDDIRSLEFEDNISKLDVIKKTVENARTDSAAYLAAFTALIKMEEAAYSKRVADFDLKSAEVTQISGKDRQFQLEFDVSWLFLFTI